MKQYNQSVKGKLFQYFDQRLGLKKSTKGWYRTDCRWCGGRFSMGVNISDSKIHCFKCLERKSPIEFLMELEKFETYAQARQFLNLREEYEYYEGQVSKKVDYKPIDLPNGYHLITNGDNVYGESARNYMRGRRFNLTKLAMKGVGYCDEGEYEGYIIFPFYKQGGLYYFQGRKFMGNGPKMKNPSEEEFGIGKTQIIYNQDALYMYDRIRWVESITNSLTLGDNAVGGLGKTISNYQLYHLLYSPCSRVDIVLDPDAMKEAVEMALSIVHYKRVKVVKMPDGFDVNDLGRSKTIKIINKHHYLKYMELFRLKLNLNGKNSIDTRQRGPLNKVDRRGV